MFDLASDNGFCIFCGYPLRGLPSGICPECGRAFDPENPKTFDSSARQSHRRRWRRAGIALLILALIVFALCPRRMHTMFVTFGCPNCLETLTVRRTQPQPAPWLPIQLPGWVSRQRGEAPPSSDSPHICTDHHMGDSLVGIDLGQIRMGGSAQNPMNRRGGIIINGMSVTPETAADVMRKLMSPRQFNRGATLQFRPIADAPAAPSPAGAK
ncbi:MAG: hypothetical protein IT449_10655 [Phycisphaerales bacterium]|nr:hypothetical protein [Phycisphaerales bacterium]